MSDDTRSDRLLHAIGAMLRASDADETEVLEALTNALGFEIAACACCPRHAKRMARRVGRVLRDVATTEFAEEAGEAPDNGEPFDEDELLAGGVLH